MTASKIQTRRTTRLILNKRLNALSFFCDFFLFTNINLTPFKANAYAYILEGERTFLSAVEDQHLTESRYRRTPKSAFLSNIIITPQKHLVQVS